MRSSNKPWDTRVLPITIWQVAEVEKRLTKEQPMFRMRGGGIYAIGYQEGKATSFIRVDKPKAPPKIRKILKRKARQMAIAAEFKH